MKEIQYLCPSLAYCSVRGTLFVYGSLHDMCDFRFFRTQIRGAITYNRPTFFFAH